MMPKRVISFIREIWGDNIGAQSSYQGKRSSGSCKVPVTAQSFQRKLPSRCWVRGRYFSTAAERVLLTEQETAAVSYFQEKSHLE